MFSLSSLVVRLFELCGLYLWHSDDNGCVAVLLAGTKHILLSSYFHSFCNQTLSVIEISEDVCFTYTYYSRNANLKRLGLSTSFGGLLSLIPRAPKGRRCVCVR